MRSGLEEDISRQLKEMGCDFSYESQTILYQKEPSKYKPDFIVGNLIIECKGRFLPSDRKKHLLIKKQHPDLDIRFIFSDSRQRLSKRSKTTLGQWCAKHGFLYADKKVPRGWIRL